MSICRLQLTSSIIEHVYRGSTRCASSERVVPADYLMLHSLSYFILPFINSHLDTVPSIATLYTQNRKRHDATARQWTQTYAKPKPPPPLPAPAEVPDNLPKTNKSPKGKNRADAQAVNNAGGSSSTSRSTTSTTGGIIAVDSDADEDADDERAAAGSKVKSTKRKRASNGSSAPSGSEVLDLLDSEEEKAIKRSRTRKAQSRADRNSGAGGSRVTRSQLDDVIVVEDD